MGAFASVCSCMLVVVTVKDNINVTFGISTRILVYVHVPAKSVYQVETRVLINLVILFSCVMFLQVSMMLESTYFAVHSCFRYC